MNNNNNNNNNNVKFTLILLSSYIFGVLIRLYLAYLTKDSYWHTIDGEYLSILSPDPALYGYQAKQLLEGISLDNIQLISYVIVFFVKMGINIDIFMYYAPAFFSSLVIIPVMLILRVYKINNYISAIFGVISTLGFGYYSRTYLGYFDTDVLNVFFSLIILYSIIAVIEKRNIFYLLIGILAAVLFNEWYSQGKMFVSVLFLGFFIYVFLFEFNKFLKYKVIFLFIVAGILFYYKIDLRIFEVNIKRYLLKDEFLNTIIHGNDYKLLTPMSFVAEANGYNIYKISEALFGNIYLLILAIIGYIVTIIKHRTFLLTLPLVLFSFLSITLGIRFSMYSNQILAIAYLFLVVSSFNYLKEKYSNKLMIIIPISLVSILLVSLYENLKYWNTKVAVPVFLPQQVKVLEKLKELSKPKDYVVTWWDYGWPIWYYTGMSTLIDNGKHHQDNYIVSKIFMSGSNSQANHMIHLFYELNKKGSPSFNRVAWRYKDMNKLFKRLELEDLIKEKKSKKFIFIPFQMFETLYTMYTFSNLDINTGEKFKQNIYLETKFEKEDKTTVYFKSNSKIDKVNGLFFYKNKSFPIKNIHNITQKGLTKKITTKKGNVNGLEVIIYNKKFFIMDDKFFNSLIVQLFFFDNYDEKYFEKLISTEQLKLYKVK